MNMVPMARTYASVLVNYRDTVNKNFPDTSINNTITLQRVQQTNTGSDGRGSSEIGGRGVRGVRGGRGWVGQDGGQRNDEWQVIGIDGTTIKVHPEYRFEHEQWFNIPETVRNQLNYM